MNGSATRCALRAALALLCCTGLSTLATPSSAYAGALPAVATSAALPASAPAAKSAPSAAPPESPSSATASTAAESPNTSGPGSSSSASAVHGPSVTSAASVTSAPAATSAPPASPAVAKQAARTGTPAAADNRPPPYTPPAQQLRFGSYAVFRNLIPSQQLEAQAADEFDQIVYGAQHADRLYPDTDARVIRVHTILDKLIPYSLKWNEREKNWKWQIAVIRSPDIRMYCLPGGKIVIYSGILDRVHLNDNELGMLLGHEIAHALREHARERLGEQQAGQLDSSGTIPQLFGLADLGVAPLGIGSQLLEMKYTPTDETEADVIGSDIASRAGYDPRAAITLWDKLAAATHSNRNQGYIYVHPYTPARRQDLMKRLPDMLQLYAKATGTTVDELPDYAGIGRPRRVPVRGD
nr:M48 family metallopeptidase [Paraburkholderia phenazinium]